MKAHLNWLVGVLLLGLSVFGLAQPAAATPVLYDLIFTNITCTSACAVCDFAGQGYTWSLVCVNGNNNPEIAFSVDSPDLTNTPCLCTGCVSTRCFPCTNSAVDQITLCNSVTNALTFHAIDCGGFTFCCPPGIFVQQPECTVFSGFECGAQVFSKCCNVDSLTVLIPPCGQLPPLLGIEVFDFATHDVQIGSFNLQIVTGPELNAGTGGAAGLPLAMALLLLLESRRRKR